jgi:diguanylate cyclase (GGDEF)-like protein
MMKLLPRLVVFSTPLLASAPAYAAAPGSAVTVGGYVAGALGVFAAVRFWLESKRLLDKNEDLDERLTLSERTVAQLQISRADDERALASATAAVKEAQQQRQEAQEMLAALRQQVERIARVDGLTGVANRQQFATSLDAEIKRTVRNRKPLSLLFAELDFFVDYSDIHGRDKSDHTLQRVALCVSETFRRAGDLVARVGAARFAIILPEADTETGERFAEKLRRRIYEMCIPFPGSDAADRVTVSVGVVSVAPNRLHDRDYVVAMAENALMQAQSGGHNRISLSAYAAA